MKNYANFSLATLQLNDIPNPPSLGACSAADTATDIEAPITGTPQPPGMKHTTCDMTTATCTLP